MLIINFFIKNNCFLQMCFIHMILINFFIIWKIKYKNYKKLNNNEEFLPGIVTSPWFRVPRVFRETFFFLTCGFSVVTFSGGVMG